jgi:hypothetical protein
VRSGAKLLQIHYKKPIQEQDTLSDRSRIGLYFTDPPASGRELRRFRRARRRGAASRTASGFCGDAAGRRTRPRVAADARQAYGSVDIVA